MADGRTAPLAEIRPGDRIYGTVQVDQYRRYAATTVLDHWSTIKPAYRVVLEDDTEIICSGDHRFWTARGKWKHVTGAECGDLRRPHLTLNDKLMGVGRLAAAPDHNAEYQAGYLCGMIRGDGTLGSRDYLRRNGKSWTHHLFRLALVDVEGLRRTRAYLDGIEVETQTFQFAAAAGDHQEVNAIRTQRRDSVEAIRSAIRFPRWPGTDWRKGFLAGLFDAEGSYGDYRVLRIANTDAELIDRTQRYLTELGFDVVVEDRHLENGLKCVRIRGGICEHLRFFHTVDPAISRKRSIEGAMIKSNARLRVVSIEPLGVELPLYDITTGTGDFIANGVVSHNCFARPTHTYLDFDAGRDFEKEIVVKVNVPEVAAGGADAAVVEARARRAWDEHRPVPVGRGALQAHAGDLGGDAGLAARRGRCSRSRRCCCATSSCSSRSTRWPGSPRTSRSRRSTRRPGAPASRTRRIRASGSRRWPS